MTTEASVKMDWSNLPDVALLEIYKCLSDKERVATALVCKNWKRLYETPLLWRYRCVSLGGFNAMDSAERAWKYIQRFGKHLRTLVIRFHGPTYRTVKSISLATEFFLKKLATTAGIKIKDFTLFHANMERHWHFVASKNRVVSALCRFLRRCRDLETLNLIAARLSLVDGCRVLEALGRGPAAKKLKIFYMEDMFQSDVTPVSITRYREAMVKLVALEYIYTNYNTMCGDILRMYARQQKIDKLTLTIDNDVNNCLIPPEEWTNFKYNCPSTKVIFYLYASGFRHPIHHALPETVPMYEVDIIAWPAIVENRMDSLQRLCGLIHHLGNVYSESLGSFSLHLDKHMPVDDEILYFLGRCQRIRDLSLFCRMSVSTVEKICRMQQNHHINLRSLNLGVLGLDESELRYLLFIRKQLMQAINQRNPNVIITSQAISSDEEEVDTEDETEESENEEEINGDENDRNNENQVPEAVVRPGENRNHVGDVAGPGGIQNQGPGVAAAPGVVQNIGEENVGNNIDQYNQEADNRNDDRQQNNENEAENNDVVAAGDENAPRNDENHAAENNEENQVNNENFNNENDVERAEDADVDANINNENVNVGNDENLDDVDNENNENEEENNEGEQNEDENNEEEDENDITDDEDGVFAALMFDSNDESDEDYQPEFIDINESDNDYPDDSDGTDEEIDVEADDEATEEDDYDGKSSGDESADTDDDPDICIPKKKMKLDESDHSSHGNSSSCSHQIAGTCMVRTPEHTADISTEQPNSEHIAAELFTRCSTDVIPTNMVTNTSIEVRYLTATGRSANTALSQLHTYRDDSGSPTNVSAANECSRSHVTVNDMLGAWEYEELEPTEWDYVLDGEYQSAEHPQFYVAPSQRVELGGQHDNARMSVSDSYSGYQLTYGTLHSESCPPASHRLDRRFTVEVRDGSDTSSDSMDAEGQFSDASLSTENLQSAKTQSNEVNEELPDDRSCNSDSTVLEQNPASGSCEEKQATTATNTQFSDQFVVLPAYDSDSDADTFCTTDSSTDVLSHLSSEDDMRL